MTYKTVFVRIIKWLKVLFSVFLDIVLTRRSDDGVQYIWKRHGANTLVIVFTGMGPQRYNYKRTLRRSPYDILFIRDCWANNASYYWYEHKGNHPELLTQKLIDHIVCSGNYETLITVGSSKGGTAAIYYGLKNHAKTIIAGACQYYVGQYLAKHQYVEKPYQWHDVVGGEPKQEQEWIDILDQKLPKMIDANSGCETELYLVYSTEEHTYQEHIAPLVAKLDECRIQHHDQVERFQQHSMIGHYFSEALNKLLVDSVTKMPNM